MTRTIPGALATHLAGESTTLATCWKVRRRDETIFRFTDHDQDISVDISDGEGLATYLAATGFRRASITGTADGSVSETELAGMLDDDSITEEDLRNGVWDYAEVWIFALNWASPTDGIIKFERGKIGEVTSTDTGAFRAELRGLAQALQQPIGEVVAPECRATLGDVRCKIPLLPDVIGRETTYYVADNLTRSEPDFVRVAIGTDGDSRDYEDLIWECTTGGTTDDVAPSYSGPAGTVVTDGTAVFTARDAWTVVGEVDAVTSRARFTVASPWIEGARHVDGFFEKGAIVFETGANAGAMREVLFWDADTKEFQVLGPFQFDIAPGDVFRASPGCDSRAATCQTVFLNFLNFRGEHLLPGADALLQVERT